MPSHDCLFAVPVVEGAGSPGVEATVAEIAKLWGRIMQVWLG